MDTRMRRVVGSCDGWSRMPKGCSRRAASSSARRAARSASGLRGRAIGWPTSSKSSCGAAGAPREVDRYAHEHPWQLAAIGVAATLAIALVALLVVESHRD